MFYTSYAKSVISHGLLVYGGTPKHQLFHIEVAQRQVLQAFFIKRKYDSMTCLMTANGISNVYDLYRFEAFKELLKELRAQSPLYVIRNMITLPWFSARFRDNGLRTEEIARTKMSERSVRNTLMKAYNLTMKLNLIPINLKHMSDCSLTAHLNMINKLFIMDNEELIRDFF